MGVPVSPPCVPNLLLHQEEKQEQHRFDHHSLLRESIVLSNCAISQSFSSSCERRLSISSCWSSTTHSSLSFAAVSWTTSSSAASRASSRLLFSSQASSRPWISSL